MSGFTKGPWNVEEGYIQRDSGGIQYWQITDDQDAICCNAFCYAGFDPKVNSANAHLLAAAPDLFEALTAIINSGVALTQVQAIDAREAIAKAIGATS